MIHSKPIIFFQNNVSPVFFLLLLHSSILIELILTGALYFLLHLNDLRWLLGRCGARTFGQCDISSICHFVNLILCHFVNVKLHQFAVLSTCHFVSLPFCQHVNLTFCQLEILSVSQIAILSTCHYVILWTCQLAILSFCQLAI